MNDNIHSSELFNECYTVYRVDRDLSRTTKTDGGGCLVAVKSKYYSYRLDDWAVMDGDMWISIQKSDNENLIINVKYIGCYYTLGQYNIHLKKIEEIVAVTSPNSEFLLLGDYNLSESITWIADSDGICSANNIHVTKKLMAHALVDVLSTTGLSQFNHVKNNLNRTLDLVLSNIDHSKLSLIEDIDPLVKLDKQHPALYLTVNLKPLKYLDEKRQPKFNFFRANYIELNNVVQSIDWESELKHLNIDEATNRFYELMQILMVNVPRVKFRTSKFPCWYSNELIKMISRKSTIKQLYDEKKKLGVDVSKDYELFSALRKEVKRLQNECHDQYVSNIEEKLSSNTKCFFAYTKARKASNSLPTVVYRNGATATNRQSVCDLFADHFASVYQRPDTGILHSTQRASNLTMEPITIIEVKRILMKLDQYKASSPDMLTAIFYKSLAGTISLPLSILYNKSLTEGKYPDPWKLSYVTPVYKSGNRANVENYRPISILCTISKVFERLVFNRLYAHIRIHIRLSQHGFLPGKSSLTNLLEHMNFIVDAIANGGQVDTIFTDFSKAFDKVSHNLLLQDLESIGVKEVYLRWFRTYLVDRTQVVMIGSTKSKIFNPSSGIPQGSILGPLLFLIFINSLPDIFKTSSSSLFADDHKLSKKINDVNDCLALQSDLDLLSDWCKKRLLNLNVKKCDMLTFTYKPEKIDFNYKINDGAVERVPVKQDLGIEFDEKVKFKSHMYSLTRKCYRMLGFIFRTTSHFKSHESLLKLYYAYVRSRLEYCCSIWNPQYTKYIDLIERVQKKFTRLLYYRFNWIKPDYKTRLKQLHMLSLETRRLQIDEMLLYKLFHCRVQSTISSLITLYQPQRFTKNPPKFYLSRPATNYIAHAPVYRIKDRHNTIFSSLDINSANYVRFKRSVKNFFDY